MVRRAVVLVIGLLAIVMAAADAQTARPEISVRMQFQRAVTLDPAFLTRASDYFVYFNIFNSLVRWKPGGSDLEPDLAERWEGSPDGRAWTFYLRKGVQFHKGYGELTADDVRFTFERFLDKDLASPEAGAYTNLDKVEALDRYTVRIILKEPSFTFVASQVTSRGAMIVSMRAVREKGKAFGRDPIGTGPFMFDRWTSGDSIVVTANDRYFGGRPQVGKVTFVPIEEEEVAVAALERGEIHVMWSRGSPDAIHQLQANKGITTQVVRRLGSMRYLGIHPDYAPLRDPRIRRALAYTINKKELELASGGMLTPANHILPSLPWLQRAAEAGKFPVYNYDPARAKRLLSDAGVPALRFALTYPLRSPDPLVVQVLAEQMRRVGIEMTLDGLEPRTWQRRWQSGQFQMIIRGTGRGLDPDELARELLHTSNFPPGDNMVRYDRADALIDSAARERDLRRRQEIYIALMKQVMTDLPYLPLLNDTFIAAWRPPIKTMITGISNDFPAFTIEVGKP